MAEYIMRSFEALDKKMNTRESDGNLYIEGYFSVFDSPYKMGDFGVETVARGAFAKTLTGDIKALVNHDSTLVLGRTAAGTLELKEDNYGLWGKITINPNDSDAMNLYERVKRHDVTQCSFGFDILDEETEYSEDGKAHWTIREVKLYEVSVCTFPAYEDTSISARQKDFDTLVQRQKEAEFDTWKNSMLEQFKKGNDENA